MSKHSGRKLGPNVKNLGVMFAAKNAIPEGGGLADGLKFLSSAESIRSGVMAGMDQALDAIDAVKQSPDNPFGDDDEAIAEHILKEVERKRNDGS